MTAPITEERLAEIEREVGLSELHRNDLRLLADLPDLLAEVRRLRAEIQEMAVLVGRLRRESDTLRADLAEEKQEHQATLAMNVTLRERVKVLEGALEESRRWMGDPEDPSGSFDELAERFRRATGHMAPGKDAPAAMGGDREGRRDAWESWLRQERARVWGVADAALGGGQ